MLVLTALTALIAFLAAPALIKLLNRIKFWKKTARNKAITGEEATVFLSLHKERETTVPRGGGLLIWVSVLAVSLLVMGITSLPPQIWEKIGLAQPWWMSILGFFTRKEVWLPMFTLVVGSLVGLLDDTLTVYGKGKYIGGGISFKIRLAIVTMIGLVGGWWFYYKLGYTTMHIPLIFNFPVGIDITLGEIFGIPLYIILFVAVMLASWAGGVIDGIDGLAGGAFASIFAAFALIAFSQGMPDLATFCAIICGALFAFLWFNIPPAKFYMGETGVLGLTSTMTVVAFLTDSVVVLPIIAGLLVMEAGSVIIQLACKKVKKKKLWLSTPIHHHFEAIGWPAYKVTMRFWILGIIFAALGVAIRLLGQAPDNIFK
jgi:phospho-N-acetylmuramoyl-pentapeptide-transferase